MNIFLLLTILSLSGVLAYHIFDRNILSPTLIIIFAFLISTISVILNINNWFTGISFHTILIIMLSIISIGLGEFLAKNLVIRNIGYHSKLDILNKMNLTYKFENVTSIQIPFFITAIIIVAMLLITVLYFKFTYELSIISGNKNGLADMIHYARVGYNSAQIKSDPSIIISQGTLLSKCLAYFYIYCILLNFSNNSFNKKNLIYFTPILIYLFQLLLSTQRTTMIALVCFTLIIYFIIYILKYEIPNIKKMIKIIFICGLALAFIFVLFGLFTGKTQKFGILNSLTLYAGGSIIAFDKYLPVLSRSSFFGEATLRLFYTALGRFGFNVPQYNEYFYEFSVIGESSKTNVYTALRRYLQDYGTIGMIIICVIIGLVFGYFLYKIFKEKKVGINIFIYASFFYPIFLFSIEEYAMRHFISLMTLYTLFYYFIIFILFSRFLIKKEE